MGGRRSADEGRHRDGQNTREDVRPVRVAPGGADGEVQIRVAEGPALAEVPVRADREHLRHLLRDRKSTRLNSSHVRISYAVFCLKKKNRPPGPTRTSLPYYP